jgi:hypothetical protein
MNDNTTPNGELIYTDFVDVGPELGCAAADYDGECERLDQCYTEACEGTPYTIAVRPLCRRDEAPGLYAECAGDLQILGYTIPVPQAVRDICDRAWELYCAS